MCPTCQHSHLTTLKFPILIAVAQAEQERQVTYLELTFSLSAFPKPHSRLALNHCLHPLALLPLPGSYHRQLAAVPPSLHPLPASNGRPPSHSFPGTGRPAALSVLPE